MSEKVFRDLKSRFQGYRNLNKFRKCGRFTDLKIEVEGGLYVDAHRAVLAERVPYLENILDGVINEGAVFKLSWPQFPISLVEEIVSYIYEGTIKLNKKNVEPVYFLANTLGCDQLRRFCLEFMSSTPTNEKLPPYLNIARATASDEIYKVLFSKIPRENNLPEVFTEDEVGKFLHMSGHSSDRKLELISVWATSKSNVFKDKDSISIAFTRFLRYIDAVQLSHSAINNFMWSDSVFALNRNCRNYLKAISSNCSPQRLLAYGKSTDNRAIVSAVKEFTEPNQHIASVRFPYLPCSSVASLHGNVYVLGGRNETYSAVSTVTVINLETGAVCEGQSMLMSRHYLAVATSLDDIFVCGGWDAGALASCERLRPAASPSWNVMPSLTEKRFNAAAVVFVNKDGEQQLLVAGGCCNGTALSSVELLHLQAQQSARWINVAPMHWARRWHGIRFFRGRIVVAGGWGVTTKLNSVEMFSPPRATGDLGQWTQMQPLAQILGWVSLTVWKDRLLAFGFSDNQIEELIDQRRLDSTNNLTEDMLPHFKWRPVCNFPENMSTVVGVVLLQRNQMKSLACPNAYTVAC